ncbi:MAPEG family protein [Mesorhizobium sp. CAU 1741]|uniref:MAPEG family protein n=1 Tax=Mesorhizobium sp. CAU 1741 TaxID=3140366 RepID=UPI00325B5B3D
MVWYILAALLLLLGQAFYVGALLTRQVGPENQTGPRDNLPEPTVELGRARRAFANLQETLPIFLTIGLLIVIYDVGGWLVQAGGLLFLAGRVAHLYCYMNALSPWRSVAFMVSLLGMLLMAVALVMAIV